MDLFHLVLSIHILSGTVALLFAPLAMVTIKGGRWHRRWGKTYFWAMAGAALTAAVMCWLQSGLFLFLIAIFSFYLALTGYGVLKRKKPGNKPHVLDGCSAIALVLAGAGLIVLSAFGDNGSERWVR